VRLVRRQGIEGEFDLPIRIYALAKQLKIENKALVDICNQIGIAGKGSALASLTDEEAAQVKAHLDRGKSGKGATATLAPPAGAGADRISGAPGAMRRDQYIPPTGTGPKKMPVLDRKTEKPPVLKKPAEPEPVAPDVEAPLTVPADKVELPQAPETLEPPEIVEKVEKPTPPPRPPRPERTGPTIKLAPIPAAQQPPTPAKPVEPPPQKPDIKLPLDAIRASRMGTKPLSEHLRKHEERRKQQIEDDKRKAERPAKPGKARSPADATGGAAAPAGPGREKAKDKDREKDKDRGRRPPARPGAPAKKEEEGAVTLGGREQRQLKRKRGPTGRRSDSEEDEPVRATRLTLRRLKRGAISTAAPRKSNVVVELPCTVRSFSEAVGVPAARVMGELMKLGFPSIITASLDQEVAQMLAMSLGIEIDFRQPASLEEKLLARFDQEEDPESLVLRPPVVTFLGHVDHGKTSLLDRILGLDVAAHEKGGITQHIRAYQVDKEGRRITFVDTPGHEAFTAMRARGANVTDIAVLVVAADDGVMPQTEEAISHAKAAGVPIVVALNKVDLPGINFDRIMQELATNELLPADWGGDTELVRTSATTGTGMDDLLDTLLTVAELREIRANPDRPAMGICLETEVQPGRGVVAKMLVQKGTLRVGDVIVCGTAHGRVKAMYDTLNPYKKFKEAGPSTPVNLTGLDMAPGAGDRFYAIADISEARQIAQDRAAVNRQRDLVGGERPHVTLENLRERLSEREDVQNLNIILRADTRGSIEAITKELGKLDHPEVQIKVLQRMVGGITEADVHLADASDAVIIGFNVVPDEKARVLADQLGVQVRRYDIIYQVTEDLKAALEGMLKPEKRETELGRVLVQKVFKITKVGQVAGCRVISGTIQRDSRIRLIRENRVVGDYPIDSLKREKDDVREAREGFECGIRLGGFDDLKEGDVFEAYKIEEIRRTF
jgi:translation initiation factor IF-2